MTLTRTNPRVEATGSLQPTSLNPWQHGTSINTNIINYNAALAQAVDGYTLDQVTKYTAKVFNSYRFSQGKLKGLRLGGGANFRGAQGLATSRQVYGLNPLTNRTEFYAPNSLRYL